ncbi:MAG: lactate utilization protein, partial [Chloroflexota bacterium]
MSQFRSRARIAIEDVRLQGALEGATGTFRSSRVAALAEFPEVEALRDHFKTIRSATLARLAEHLEEFERQAQANGATVHWARDAAEASQAVVDIARGHGATLATKTKSMATEEIGLNRALNAAGIEAVETDLGEWILQLAQEPPYHIIGPAIHKTRGRVAELFSEETGQTLPADD